MKYFKLEGGNNKTQKVIEDYLDKVKFEENMLKIVNESVIFDKPFEETHTYKRYIGKLFRARHHKSWYSIQARKIMKEQGLLNECFNCGVEVKLEVHHIDKNYKNNKLENLKVLCSPCHRKYHQLGTKHRTQSKQEIKETMKKRWKEGKFNKRILPDRKGKNNPMYGRKPTQKQIEAGKKIGGWNKGMRLPNQSKGRKRDKKGRYI